MRTTVYVGTSLDGYIARPDGEIDWLETFHSKEVLASYDDFMKTVDTCVIGRGTFEKVLTFPSWPYQKKVFVLSSTLKHVPARVRGKVTLLSKRPKDVLKRLSKEGFSQVYIDGGKVIQDFLREDCIDELIVTKVPILIGSGIPLFGDLAHDLRFVHKKTVVYSNGLVKSHYERART